MKTHFVLALAILLGACQSAKTSLAAGQIETQEEFMIGLEMGNEVADPSVADWRLDQAVAVGARWVRVYIPWALIEQQKGVLTWKGTSPSYLPPLNFDLDYEMAGIRARGLRAIAIVQYTPSWARAGGDIYTPPTDPQTYGAFVQEVVKRYGKVVRVVEVWNEVDVDDSITPPNPPPDWSPFWHGSTAQYVGILNAAYDAAKLADPTVVVLSSGLAALTPPLISQWLDSFFANNPRPKFDWFGWHPYGTVREAGPDANDGTTSSFRGFERIAERLDAEGYTDAPILLSEFGYRYDVGDASMQAQAEEQVANMLPEAFAVAHSSSRIKGLVWFSVQYHGGDGDFGLYSDSRQQRISFKAFKTFASLTVSYHFVGRERGTDNGTEAQVYRFSNTDGKRLWMIYAPFVPPHFTVVEPQSVTIQVSPGAAVTIVDRDGVQRCVIADSAGNVIVLATRQPIFVKERSRLKSKGKGGKKRGQVCS